MYSGQESFWAGSLFGPITVALLLKGTGAPSINTHTHCTMYSQRLVVLLLPRRKSRGGVLLVFFLFSAALLFLNTRHSQNSVVFYRVWLEFVCAWYIRQNFFYQTLFVPPLWISEWETESRENAVSITSISLLLILPAKCGFRFLGLYCIVYSLAWKSLYCISSFQWLFYPSPESFRSLGTRK